MSFAPENPLEDALARAASDPAVRPQFYGLLMQSPLLVLGRVERHAAPDEVLPVLDGRGFELAQIEARGRRYHPAFTSVSRLRAFDSETEAYFTVIARALFAHTRGAAFLINCGSEVGKELLPREIEYLLDPRPRRMRPGSRGAITVRLPQPYPGRLTGALGIFFLNRSQVAAAHLVETVGSDGGPPHLLIGLVAHGDVKHIVAGIGQVAAAINIANIVDVMVLDPARRDSHVQAQLLSTPPFYARPITPQSQGIH